METNATASKQEIFGSATSAPTGPSSTWSSLTGEPKYLSTHPLTAQAINLTILFVWIATPNARSLGQQRRRERERRERQQQSVSRGENNQSKCIECFESIPLHANAVNRPSRQWIRIHHSYTPSSYTFSSNIQCRADSEYLHLLLFVITNLDLPTTVSSMQEFSMLALKGQDSSEMQTKTLTALELLLDLRHLHLKMPQLQLQVSILLYI